MFRRFLALIGLLPFLTACLSAPTPIHKAILTPEPTFTRVPPTITASFTPPPHTPTPTGTAAPTSTDVPPSPTLSPTPAPVLTTSSTITEETRGTVTVRITTITRRYQIIGYSATDLEAQMRTYGPTDAFSGIHWYALTEPGFDWQHEGPCTDQGCTAGQVLIDLTIRYTYPHWGSAATADPVLRDQWAGFANALVLHEEGHGTLAISCAWRIGEAFAALPPAASSADFEWSMRLAIEAILAECRNEQRGYENNTDHGRTQGVVWGN